MSIDVEITSGASPVPQKPRPSGAVFWSVVVLASLLLGGLVAGAFLSYARPRERISLPVYSQIDGFSLVERSGKATSLDDLRGKIWVGNFIYTSCPTVCPKLTARMGEMQRFVHAYESKLGRDAGVRLVSFTVDPENDTPEQLARYATEFGADSRIWLFLTGSLDEIGRAVIDGMKIPFEKRGTNPAMEIMHGEKFVLVDGRGQIRGYFDADLEGMARLERAIEALVEEVSS